MSKKITNDKKSDSNFYIFLQDFFTGMAAHAKAGGGWYIWHADSEGANFRTAMVQSGILLKQCLIWVKNVFVMGRQDYQWKHEPCLYGWKEGAAHTFTPERTHSTVFEYEQDFNSLTKKELVKLITHMTSELPSTVIECDKPSRNGEHPTMKPIALLGELIQNSSSIGEIVADPFGGSGSTMVASEQLKRKCRMMELDPKYCQVILDRMMKLDESLPITKNGKKYAI
jgi:DNA modification methylase